MSDPAVADWIDVDTDISPPTSSRSRVALPVEGQHLRQFRAPEGRELAVYHESIPAAARDQYRVDRPSLSDDVGAPLVYALAGAEKRYHGPNSSTSGALAACRVKVTIALLIWGSSVSLRR